MESSEIVLKGDNTDILVEVIEQTVYNGVNYVLVLEKQKESELDDESENLCFILKEKIVDKDGIIEYENVEDSEEYENVSSIFKKILIRDDIELI